MCGQGGGRGQSGMTGGGFAGLRASLRFPGLLPLSLGARGLGDDLVREEPSPSAHGPPALPMLGASSYAPLPAGQTWAPE